jgi:hypothetical protein
MLSSRAMLLVGLGPEQHYSHWRVDVRVRLVAPPLAVPYIQSNRQTRGHREALIHQLIFHRPRLFVWIFPVVPTEFCCVERASGLGTVREFVEGLTVDIQIEGNCESGERAKLQRNLLWNGGKESATRSLSSTLPATICFLFLDHHHRVVSHALIGRFAFLPPFLPPGKTVPGAVGSRAGLAAPSPMSCDPLHDRSSSHTGGRGGLTWQAHCEFVESF